MTVRLEIPVDADPGGPINAAAELPLIVPRVSPREAAGEHGRPVVPVTRGARPRQFGGTALALPQVTDPTYYSAHDLDVYPQPVMPLDLDHLAGGDAAGTGRFRLDLLIDESGVVDKIALIEADPPGPLQEALRAALMATRFEPGQRGGRAVKSRVVLRVSFQPVREGNDR